MKLLPIVLINAVLVAGGIVIYDQVRGDGPATTYATDGGGDDVQIAQITERVAALEGRAPTLRATGSDPRILARLEALETRAAVRAPSGGTSTPDADGAAPAEDALALPDVPEGEQPANEDVRRFRRLMEAAEQQRRDERDRERLLAVLKDLDITLNAEQTNKLVAAQRDYRSKVGDVWRKAFSGIREAGADREGMREAARQGMEGLRDQFGVTINKFVPSADAQKIIENMNRIGGRSFGGGAMMSGRRRR